MGLNQTDLEPLTGLEVGSKGRTHRFGGKMLRRVEKLITGGALPPRRSHPPPPRLRYTSYQIQHVFFTAAFLTLKRGAATVVSLARGRLRV